MRYLNIVFIFFLCSAAPTNASCGFMGTLIGEAEWRSGPEAPPSAWVHENNIIPKTLLVLGQFDESFTFEGVILDETGSDQPIVAQIEPNPHGFHSFISGPVPQVLGMPQENQRFVGYLRAAVRLRPAEDRTLNRFGVPESYYVLRTICSEGWVADPSDEYIGALRLCLQGGECTE